MSATITAIYSLHMTSTRLEHCNTTVNKRDRSYASVRSEGAIGSIHRQTDHRPASKSGNDLKRSFKVIRNLTIQ